MKFKIGQHVVILPIERRGKVNGIFMGKHGIEYRIRYFDNAEGKDLYFDEDELRGEENSIKMPEPPKDKTLTHDG
jgi:hypothetical protein